MGALLSGPLGAVLIAKPLPSSPGDHTHTAASPGQGREGAVRRGRDAPTGPGEEAEGREGPG